VSDQHLLKRRFRWRDNNHLVSVEYVSLRSVFSNMIMTINVFKFLDIYNTKNQRTFALNRISTFLTSAKFRQALKCDPFSTNLYVCMQFQLCCRKQYFVENDWIWPDKVFVSPIALTGSWWFSGISMTVTWSSWQTASILLMLPAFWHLWTLGYASI